MRLVLVNLAHAAELSSPEALLDEYRSLTGWADALAEAGAEVAAVQGFTRDAELERRGVRYVFVAGRYAPRLASWRPAHRALRAVLALEPDVVHLNGLLYALQARTLRARLPASCALVAQHHAERPALGPAALLQRRGLEAVDGFFFTGAEAARPWRERCLIGESQPVFEIVEGSSRLRFDERSAARRATGLEGEPVCLWLGNLDRNKDPLTVLEGFERLLAERPRARLYMAYRHAGLEPRVDERIAASGALKGSVELLGRIPYGELEPYLNSADFFLQGSRYEGSGYALLDAMACGVVPVVTDIPSFRFIVGGSCGALWPPGDAGALHAALLRLVRQPLEPQRRAVRAAFEERLGFEAIGRQAMAAYSELVVARAQMTS